MTYAQCAQGWKKLNFEVQKEGLRLIVLKTTDNRGTSREKMGSKALFDKFLCASDVQQYFARIDNASLYA